MPSAKRFRTRKRTSEESSSWGSPAQVLADDDLLAEILLHLPIKSLLRFKSVSKKWLSLISDPHFIGRKSLQPNTVSALFGLTAHRRSSPFRYSIVPLHPLQRKAPLTSITLEGPPHGIGILSSCNGLLLCSSSLCSLSRNKSKYYIYNPTTRQFRTLPSPCGEAANNQFNGFCLAFDPPKSLGYRVACIQRSAPPSYDHCQIVVYSSETGGWRVSGTPFLLCSGASFHNGVYCNGAIYWVNESGRSLLFDLEEEVAYQLPMPSNHFAGSGKVIAYFGESSGHLHLVETHSFYSSQFPVYEMKRDRTGWFVKFQVDLTGAVASAGHNIYSHQHYRICSHVLCVGRGDNAEEFFLLVHAGGKIIRYNFRNKTHQAIHNTYSGSKLIQFNTWKRTYELIGRTNSKTVPAGWPFVYQHMHSISLV